MLKIVLLVLAFCVLTTVRAQQPCLGAPAYLPHSFVAASQSCDAYVICMGGQTIHGQRCPAGMLFEPISETCGQSSCQDCSRFGIQNLPHPDSCDQFIECIMGTRTFRTCPSPLLFDRTVANCNEPHLVLCPGQPTEDPYPTEEWTTDTWITDPWTPDPNPTEPWPPITDPPPTNPPSLPICVPGGQVHHAHPTDCTRFFLCICLHTECTLWEQQCQSKLHWNQIVNVCDYPERAGCLNRPTDAPWPPTDAPWPPTDAPWPPVDPTDPPLFPPTDTEKIKTEDNVHKITVVYLNGEKEEIVQSV